MKLSAFNLYAPDMPGAGMTLVHNTYSGAFTVVDQETLAALRKRDRGERLDEHERALIDDELAHPDVGVVVASLDAEERSFLDWFEQRRAERTLQSIVAVNLACNFECPYCCQADVMDGSVMKPEIVADTADWLAGRAIEIDADRAHITFIGGEPLLHADRIKTMAARMRARLAPHGIELSIGLITNGYFLSDEMVQELLPYGLAAAKVTLDGDDTTHHLTRVSRRGEDTFARIFDNIVNASRHIQITVNGNYQDNTISGFGPLVEKLSRAGLPANTHINFTPALQILGAPEDSGSGACTWSGSAYGYRVALHDKIIQHGFETVPLQKVGPCAFHAHHMYAIDPDGAIFKCPGFLGHPEWRIGDVSTGLNERYQQLLNVRWHDSCGGCAHRPNCGGGCLAEEMLRTGQTDGVHCERPYFEAVTRDALAREYALASGDFEPPHPPVELPRTQRGVRPASLRVL